MNTCFDLCDLTEAASGAEGSCTSDYAMGRGYDTTHPDCLILADAFDRGVATAAMCNACYRSISVTDGDCRDAHSACFDTAPPPGDAGGPPPGEDAGPPPGEDAGTPPGDDAGTPPGDDAGPPPTGVNTCNELCALTPTTSPTEAACVPDAVAGLGYDTDNVPCQLFALNFTGGVGTVTQCMACYTTISITDADCRSVHTMCY